VTVTGGNPGGSCSLVLSDGPHTAFANIANNVGSFSPH